MQIHKFMSDTEDLLEWIGTKSPQARSQNIGIDLLGKLSSETADEEARKVSSMEKARSQQEKLRHEMSAMQKQMDKLDREQMRLQNDYPSRAEEIHKRWQAVQTAWDVLRRSVQADKQRLTEAQMVTDWTDRCNLLISWIEERRLAMLAVRVMPTELDEATRLLNEHNSIKTQLSKRNSEKEAIERSAYELTEKVPSAKIVINQHCQKLATSWANTQSVWNTRSILYEKNLDLRLKAVPIPYGGLQPLKGLTGFGDPMSNLLVEKLLSEMSEIESWLEEQEVRLKDLHLASEESSLNVDKAMKEQDDIERAVEHAKQRVEAIKRKTAIEKVGFELLKFAAARGEGADGDPNSGIISEARVAEIRRRETSKINQSRSKNSDQVRELPPSTAKNIFTSLTEGADGRAGYSSEPVSPPYIADKQRQQPAAHVLIQPTIKTVEKSAPVSCLQDSSYDFRSGLNRVDSFGMSSAVRTTDTAITSHDLKAPAASTAQPAMQSAKTASPQRINSTESSDGGVRQKISDLFFSFKRKSDEVNTKGRKVSQSGDKTKITTLGGEPAHGGQNRERSAKSGRKGRPLPPAQSASDIDVSYCFSTQSQTLTSDQRERQSEDEAATGEKKTYIIASLPPSSPSQDVNERVLSTSSPVRSPEVGRSDRFSFGIDTNITGKSGYQNEVKCIGNLTRKIINDPKKAIKVFKKWIPSNGPGHHAVLTGASLVFYDNQTGNRFSLPRFFIQQTDIG
ncbi:unnamed protein product [Schistocephalus solidus]|uniref:Dystrophin n=1 Tax=Schistocephalus solidus TaxID=70667 RepID=A0A183T8T0_SCHSO|nr:unnamed protein product [Schistocephalus solidus]